MYSFELRQLRSFAYKCLLQKLFGGLKCLFSQKFVKSRFSIQRTNLPCPLPALRYTRFHCIVKPFVWALPLKGKTTNPSSPYLDRSPPYIDRYYFSLKKSKKASFELSIKKKYANVKLINSLRTSYPAHQRSLSKVGCSSKVCRCFSLPLILHHPIRVKLWNSLQGKKACWLKSDINHINVILWASSKLS